ncbi:MAG: hypothetical protein R3E98_08170 [Gemmatimonadota bacterium]
MRALDRNGGMVRTDAGQGRWRAGNHEQAPEARKAPGNRAGALGLLAALPGAWLLIPEVPALPYPWSGRVGTVFLSFGILLAALGLILEWRGPRRPTALVPAMVLLDFLLALAGLAAWRTVFAYDVLAPEAPAGARVWTPDRSTARAAVLLVSDDPIDAPLLPRLAAALAREGVAAAVLVDGSTPQDGDLAALRALIPAAERVGVVAFGEAGADPACLDALPLDFVALISTSVPTPPALGAVGPDLLGVYAFEDTLLNPHAEAQALAAAFTASGRARAQVQVFLGSDHHLRSVTRRPLLPAAFGTTFVARLASWMEGEGF